jgi:hypothetical protein
MQSRTQLSHVSRNESGLAQSGEESLCASPNHDKGGSDAMAEPSVSAGLYRNIQPKEIVIIAHGGP